MTENGNGSTAYDIVKNTSKKKTAVLRWRMLRLTVRVSIGKSSALAALKKLTEEGRITREGSGKSIFYARADSK